MEDSKFKYPEEYDDVKITGYPVGSDITVMNVYYQRNLPLLLDEKRRLRK